MHGSLLIFSANCKLRKRGRGARSGGIKSKWLPLGGSSPHERRRASFQNSVSRDRNSPLIFDSRWSPCWWSTWWWTSCLSSACCHRSNEDGGHAGPDGDLQICSELFVYLPTVFFQDLLLIALDLVVCIRSLEKLHDSHLCHCYLDFSVSRVISMIFHLTLSKSKI